MSKPPPPSKPVVTVAPAEAANVKPGDTYDVPPVTVPFRIRRGNNEYDLVEVTFSKVDAVKVLRSRHSRMEVDYELKVLMQTFLGPNRYGPSGDE